MTQDSKTSETHHRRTPSQAERSLAAAVVVQQALLEASEELNQLQFYLKGTQSKRHAKWEAAKTRAKPVSLTITPQNSMSDNFESDASGDDASPTSSPLKSMGSSGSSSLGSCCRAAASRQLLRGAASSEEGGEGGV